MYIIPKDMTEEAKRDRAAHEIWERAAVIWETTPAYDAIKEIARLLVREGWTNAE